MSFDLLRSLFFDIRSLGLPAEVQPALWLVASLLAAYLLERAGLIAIPNLVPRGDLVGVGTVLFGHADLAHLLSNAAAIGVLAALYFLEVPNPWSGLAVLALGPGLVYWLLGRRNVAVRGASGMVYALAGWWLVYAFATGRFFGFGVAVFLMFVYGLFDLMNPFAQAPGVSIACHFWGFVVGVTWAAWSLSLLDPYLENWRIS